MMYHVTNVLILPASRMMRRTAWNQTRVKPSSSFEWTIRSIATTTRPCLKKAGRHLRKKSNIEKRGQSPDPAARRQAKIQALLEAANSSPAEGEALDEGSGKPIPFSRQVLSCPYISKDNLISWKDFKIRIEQLREELDTSNKKLQIGELQWLAINLKNIRDGHLSSTESFRAIEASLPKINNGTDRAILKDLIGWHGKTGVDQFLKMVERKLCALSPESWPILEKAMQIPPEYVESKDERALDARLDAMGSAYKTNFYNTKRDLLTRLQRHWHCETEGDSMLPTLWNPSHLIAKPLHPTRGADILSQIKVDDIVMFLVYYQSGPKKSLVKRIKGLPGDRIKTSEGKTVQVPDGCFWAVGDNLENSFDSRHFGAVPGSNLKAKGILAFTLFPPRFRIL